MLPLALGFGRVVDMQPYIPILSYEVLVLSSLSIMPKYFKLLFYELWLKDMHLGPSFFFLGMHLDNYFGIASHLWMLSLGVF